MSDKEEANGPESEETLKAELAALLKKKGLGEKLSSSESGRIAGLKKKLRNILLKRRRIRRHALEERSHQAAAPCYQVTEAELRRLQNFISLLSKETASSLKSLQAHVVVINEEIKNLKAARA